MARFYRLDAPAGAIAAAFHADPGRDPWDGGAIHPGDFAPVIVGAPEGRRRIAPRLWGVPPPPGVALRDPTRSVTHVRNLESPFWIGSLRHRHLRCLVPATGFPLRHGTAALATGEPFAFAGLWRDSEVPSFAILTCEPNRLVSALGGTAMPVILQRADEESWLTAGWSRAARLVEPFPSQLMAASEGPRQTA